MTSDVRRYVVGFHDSYEDGSTSACGLLHVLAYTAEDALTQSRRGARRSLTSVHPYIEASHGPWTGPLP